MGDSVVWAGLRIGVRSLVVAVLAVGVSHGFGILVPLGFDAGSVLAGLVRLIGSTHFVPVLAGCVLIGGLSLGSRRANDVVRILARSLLVAVLVTAGVYALEPQVALDQPLAAYCPGNGTACTRPGESGSVHELAMAIEVFYVSMLFAISLAACLLMALWCWFLPVRGVQSA